MDVSSGGGGGFFGGGNQATKNSEEALAKIAKANNLDFSIVRAGKLKGGGPGGDAEGNPAQDFGLDKIYYNSIFVFVILIFHCVQNIRK